MNQKPLLQSFQCEVFQEMRKRMEQGTGGENTETAAARENPSQQTLALAADTDRAHQIVWCDLRGGFGRHCSCWGFQCVFKCCCEEMDGSRVCGEESVWSLTTPSEKQRHTCFGYNGSDKSNFLMVGFFGECEGKGWFKKCGGANRSCVSWKLFISNGSLLYIWAELILVLACRPHAQCFALCCFICQKENKFTKYLRSCMATGLNTYIWIPWKQFASSPPQFQTSFSLHLLVQVHKFLGKNHLLHHSKMPQK